MYLFTDWFLEVDSRPNSSIRSPKWASSSSIVKDKQHSSIFLYYIHFLFVIVGNWYR
ncbi:hypothetical protein LINPERPRIM_LOCUS20952 [Linum perenne]